MGTEHSTTNYRIIKNWDKSTTKSGPDQSYWPKVGGGHACVISTPYGEIVGDYNVKSNIGYGIWGGEKFNISGGVTFINGDQ